MPPSRRGKGEYGRGGEFWRMRLGYGRESDACSAIAIQSLPVCGDVGIDTGVATGGNTDCGRTLPNGATVGAA